MESADVQVIKVLRSKAVRDDLAKLNVKQSNFVLRLMVHPDKPGQAAREAGYATKSANVMAHKLMRNPIIKGLISKLRKRQGEQYVIEANTVLEHLCACATRDGKDFVDETGRLLLTTQNINELPDNVTKAIDSIKQKEKVYTLDDGTEVVELETEIKLVSKAKALEMCMQHRGLFAAQQVEVKLPLDFDAVYEQQTKEAELINPIERRLLAEEDQTQGDSDV